MRDNLTIPQRAPGTGIEGGVLRLLAPGNQPVGAGFLVTGSELLTCAHVVTSSLGLRDIPITLPEGPLSLDFPLVAPGEICPAKVVHWRPALDLAVLRIETQIPAGAAPVPLVQSDDLWGHRFRALGFPRDHADGVWVSGELRGRTAAGWVQIEGVRQTGYLIAPGFSGGPVWDEAVGGVVGMIVAADRDPQVRAAYVLPVERLQAGWPELEARAASERSSEPSGFDPGRPHVVTQINVAGDYVGRDLIRVTGDGNIVGDHSSSHGGERPAAHAPDARGSVTATLRRRLRRLDSVQIESLCLDHFPQVYDKFGRGLRRDEMMNLLLDHCRRHPEDAPRLDALLK